MRTPWILGINANHTGSVCLLKGSRIAVAIQEERLVRDKRAEVFAGASIKGLEYCLRYVGITPGDIDLIVVCAQKGKNAIHQDIRQNSFLNVTYYNTPVYYISHHLAHAIGVYTCSAFSEAAILVIDGLGSPEKDLSIEEKAVIRGSVLSGYEIISLYFGTGTEIIPLEKFLATHGVQARDVGMSVFESLGWAFSAVSHQIFGETMEAGKVMALASYGKPSISMDKFIRFDDNEIEFRDEVCHRFPHNDRWPKHKGEYQDLAASVQRVLEESLFYLIHRFNKLCKTNKLCYTGGVALNCTANERLIRKSGFKDIFIMPSADDSGVAIGAAYWGLWYYFKYEPNPGHVHVLANDSMGKTYSKDECLSAIPQVPYIRYSRVDNIVPIVARYIADGKIIGWFQGGSEFGPRALGQRSILCDPRLIKLKKILDEKVKYRESFRPYAASILFEEVSNWFDFDGFSMESPFMLRAIPVKKEKQSTIPAVIHVDGTSRIQTVTEEANGIYYLLIKEFFRQTGVPLILNTSFNIKGDPIVETPEDAVDTFLFMGGMDILVLEDIIITRTSSLSILDLIPYIIDWQLIRQKMKTFTRELIFIITSIDGKRDGHLILKQLQHDVWASLGLSNLILSWKLTKILLKLHRMGFINFCCKDNF